MKSVIYLLLFIFVNICFSLDFLIDKSKTTLLSMPSPDGYLQATHPDIINVPKSKFKYFMVYTPYPYASLEIENVCGYFSNDGFNFFQLPTQNNPIASFSYTSDGKNMLNNDPDVYYDDIQNKYYLTYQRTYRDHSDQFVDILTSSDCIKWNPYHIINQKETLADNFSLSPTIIKKSDQYYLFFVNFTQKSIIYLKNKDFKNMNYAINSQVNIILPGNYKPWHIDIVENQNKYYMLISAYANGNIHELDLLIAESDDLLNWTVQKEPILTHGTSFFNSKKIYRSTGLIEDGRLKVWFSIQTYNNEWRIGYTEFVTK